MFILVLVANSPKKGPVVIKYNIEENATKECSLVIPSYNRNAPRITGLFRKFLGTVDGNMLFSYKELGVPGKRILGLQVNKSLLQMQMNQAFQTFTVWQTEH